MHQKQKRSIYLERILASTSPRAISLLMVIITISIILTSILAIAEIAGKSSQNTKNFNISKKIEAAILASQEKALYNINQNYCQVDTENCLAAQVLSDDSQSTSTISIDKTEPYTGQTTGIGNNITDSNPWEVVSSPNQIFTFNINLNSNYLIYPDSLTIATDGAGEVVLWTCPTTGTPRVCAGESSATTSVTTTFPQTFDLSQSNINYYKVTINNGSATSTYTLTPSSDKPLPVGVTIENIGAYQDYEKTVEIKSAKWSVVDDSGLVGWWKMDEGSGSTAYDSSKKINNGAWSGSGTHYSSDAKVGIYTGQFNGTSDYVNCGTNANLRPTSAMSLIAWLKLDTTSGIRTIASTYEAGGYGLSFNEAAYPGKLLFSAYIGGAYRYAVTNDTFSDTTNWHFLAGTYDGSRIRLYLDGILQNTGTDITGSIQYPIMPLLVAANPGAGGASASYFDGFVDDVRIYNRALSADEILALYNATK